MTCSLNARLLPKAEDMLQCSESIFPAKTRSTDMVYRIGKDDYEGLHFGCFQGAGREAGAGNRAWGYQRHRPEHTLLY